MRLPENRFGGPIRSPKKHGPHGKTKMVFNNGDRRARLFGQVLQLIRGETPSTSQREITTAIHLPAIAMQLSHLISIPGKCSGRDKCGRQMPGTRHAGYRIERIVRMRMVLISILRLHRFWSRLLTAIAHSSRVRSRVWFMPLIRTETAKYCGRFESERAELMAAFSGVLPRINRMCTLPFRILVEFQSRTVRRLILILKSAAACSPSASTTGSASGIRLRRHAIRESGAVRLSRQPLAPFRALPFPGPWTDISAIIPVVMERLSGISILCVLTKQGIRGVRE